MWSTRSKSSRRRCHSPLTRRMVPTPPRAAEETHLGASPASSWVETSPFFFVFFSFERFFYFLKINTPITLFLLIDLSPSSLLHLLHMHSCCHVHGPPCPLPPPSNLLFWSFFLLKEENCWQKHFMYLPLPPPFHFSPSCSASSLLGKAWRLACPSFFPVVNGKGKNNKKDLMRGFLNTIKIDMNFLWLILFFLVVTDKLLYCRVLQLT